MFCKALILSLLLITASLLFAGERAPAPDGLPAGGNWPQFRGPKRNGVSTDNGLLKEWPKDGPMLLWEAKGAGRGYSSVAVCAGRVYSMGDDEKDEYVVCFDETTGKEIWKAKLGPAWNSGVSESWRSSRSTPTVDGDALYILTPHGTLVCLETASGKERWRKDLVKEFDGKKADSWGYSESVLIDGDKVACTPGGPKNTMVALNKKTGDKIWASATPDERGAGHASIVIADIGQTRIYVQTTGSGAIGVRASDGKLLWNYVIDKTTAVIPTPIVRGELVFFTAGYGRGGALLRQSATPDVGIKMEEVYPLNTELHNKHGGVVLVGDYLFGDTNDTGSPYCAELLTGKVRWKGRGSGKGSASITVADDHLYIRFANGTMVLANASPDAYKEVGSFKVPHSGDRPSWAHPVVTGGKMFLREGDWVLCYDVRGR